MKIYRLERRQRLPVDIDTAWAFFSNPRNLERITPEGLRFRILTELPDHVYPGLMIGYKLRVPPGLPVTWWTEIKSVDAPHRFVDEQRAGPYAMWFHEHHLVPCADGVEMTDIVHYALPFGPLGRLAHALFVGRQVRGIFDHRSVTLERFFEDGTVPAS